MPHFKSHSEKKSIALFIPSLSGGGAEKVAIVIANFLRKNHYVHLILIEKYLQYPLPDGISAHFLYPHPHPLGILKRLLLFPLFVFRLACIIQKMQLPYVLSFMEEGNLLNIVTSFFVFHKAFIRQEIDPELQYRRKGLLGKVIRLASRWLYPHAYRVIAVSEGVKQTLIRDYHLDPLKTLSIYNPIPFSEIQILQNQGLPSSAPERFILHVGRLELAQKAQDRLIDAFALLAGRFPDLHLVFIGTGPDRGNIEKQVAQLHLMDRIHLVGWQENPFLWMHRAEALVLCSHYEGFGNVLVEAMAAKCPVVALDCRSGPAEIIGQNQYGILIAHFTPETLAQEIEGLLNHPEKQCALKAIGVKRAEAFSAEVIGKMYEELL